MNEGFDPVEIAELKKECEHEGQTYVIVEDEDGMNDSGEFAHFQFVGKHEGIEAIFDAVMGTLRLNHSSLVFEEAETRMKKAYPNYVEIDKRKPNHKVDEDLELMLEEIIEELEEVGTATSADHVAEEIGDLLFAVVNFARFHDVDAETVLKSANAKFERRFRDMEDSAGDRFTALSLDEKEDLWQQAKAKAKEAK